MVVRGKLAENIFAYAGNVGSIVIETTRPILLVHFVYWPISKEERNWV
jgi:hypothetical protein